VVILQRWRRPKAAEATSTGSPHDLEEPNTRTAHIVPPGGRRKGVGSCGGLWGERRRSVERERSRAFGEVPDDNVVLSRRPLWVSPVHGVLSLDALEGVRSGAPGTHPEVLCSHRTPQLASGILGPWGGVCTTAFWQRGIYEDVRPQDRTTRGAGGGRIRWRCVSEQRSARGVTSGDTGREACAPSRTPRSADRVAAFP